MHTKPKSIRPSGLISQCLAAVLLGLVMVASIASSSAVEVEATGSAPGSAANAREQALTDAFREAVRKGAGVDLVSQTKVTDFVLDYDRVFAASFGYVKGYAVLGAKMRGDGIYEVRIRADVQPGNPDLRDSLALRQIVQLKQSPRVALEIDEQIDGVPSGSDFAKAWFEQAARDMQLQLVDVKRATLQQDRLAARDEFLGDQNAARLRRADFAQKADFVLQARVRGRFAGQGDLRGIRVQSFSLSADLRALIPENGNLVAAVTVPGRDLDSDLASADTAGRALVHELLNGSKRTGSLGAIVLFRKIFAHWITELDLGALMMMEFTRISDSDWNRLLKTLGETEKINAVFPREFDSRGLSKMEVETRLDATGLKSEVLSVLGGSFALDHSTRHYLQFLPVSGPGRVATGQAAAPPAAAGPSAPAPAVSAAAPPTQSAPAATPGSSGMPPWMWAIIGAGGMGLLAGVFLLGKRSQR